MIGESLIMMSLLASFYWTAGYSQYSFAAVLWVCYLCLSGVFAMHPAVCSQIFGPGVDYVAIGLVGSSDIANNLLIGLFSGTLLDAFGWSGYFVGISTMCIVVLVVSILFPMKRIKEFKRDAKERLAQCPKEQARRASEGNKRLPRIRRLSRRLSEIDPNMTSIVTRM